MADLTAARTPHSIAACRHQHIINATRQAAGADALPQYHRWNTLTPPVQCGWLLLRNEGVLIYRPKRGSGREPGMPREHAWSPLRRFEGVGWYVGTPGM